MTDPKPSKPVVDVLITQAGNVCTCRVEVDGKSVASATGSSPGSARDAAIALLPNEIRALIP